VGPLFPSAQFGCADWLLNAEALRAESGWLVSMYHLYYNNEVSVALAARQWPMTNFSPFSDFFVFRLFETP
jgi:hypothetical protein